jgi:hypothetical protein
MGTPTIERTGGHLRHPHQRALSQRKFYINMGRSYQSGECGIDRRRINPHSDVRCYHQVRCLLKKRSERIVK